MREQGSSRTGLSRQIGAHECSRPHRRTSRTFGRSDLFCRVRAEVDHHKVRPIQMGEFLRKCFSRRLLAPSEGEITALTTAMRQIGIGTQGGAEALAISTTSGSQVHSMSRSPESRRRRDFSPSTLQQQCGHIDTCLTLNDGGG